MGEKRPPQRDQFETLYRRVTEESGGFELDRFPPDADPYPAVLSVHPRFEIDEDQGVIAEKEDRLRASYSTQRVNLRALKRNGPSRIWMFIRTLSCSLTHSNATK